MKPQNCENTPQKRKKEKTAVLLLHGIIGTPRHFRDFLPRIPREVFICNLLLDGHGKGVGDFSKSSMKKWKQQVEHTVETLLASFEQLIIVAHSMGCLFAIEQAVCHPKEVCRLFLMGMPVRLRIRSGLLDNIVKVYTGKIKPDDARGLAAKQAYGIRREKGLWRYLGWIPRYGELLREIRRCRTQIPLLRVPCTVYQSGDDEVVSGKSNEILRENPAISVKLLANSGHVYYAPEDYQWMLEDFGSYFASGEFV